MRLKSTKEHEVMDAQIHQLNAKLTHAKQYYFVDQSKLVDGTMGVAKGAVKLARQAIGFAKTHASTELSRADVSTWEVHIANRHLKNMHDLITKLAVKAREADVFLKTAQQDDVVNGKVLPLKPGKETPAATAAPKAKITTKAAAKAAAPKVTAAPKKKK
ncbi:hypothetical protein Ciccas_005466 [Cichlidogyrus casuarinus]|uniref:Uncharacterized protein n=1 Tax=Cichlidogyrus casuarinus TaxID=1844966 RepID=A0ABD2Q8I8_9PLAT